MAESLKHRDQSLAELRSHQAELEAELSTLKKGNHESILANAPSDSILNQLQVEVLRVVQRIQERNETIAKLKEDVTAHSKREDNLRKELKRAIRAKCHRWKSEQEWWGQPHESADTLFDEEATLSEQ